MSDESAIDTSGAHEDHAEEMILRKTWVKAEMLAALWRRYALLPLVCSNVEALTMI